MSVESELKKFIDDLGKVVPSFSEFLEEKCLSGHNKILDGTVLINQLPKLAPQAYLFSFYRKITTSNDLSNLIPSQIFRFYELCNGCTLFHSIVEIWGIIKDQDNFHNPAYDLFEENEHIKESGFERTYIGSLNDGTLISISKKSDKVFLSSSEGDDIKEFTNLDNFLISESIKWKNYYD
jgi:hypothetical protein